MIASYGHGTENDFVIIYDPENKLELTADQISHICDRNNGIGADGTIRIVKESGNALPGSPKWFMDYRNADGSIAEMCGNGIRVMAKYLVENKLQPAGIFSINTRAGVKFLAAPDQGDISVNMGPVTFVGDEISVLQNGINFENGLNINVGNPHAVVDVKDLNLVGSLAQMPVVTPGYEYPDGVNVEFIEFKSENEIAMRVYERGVGETKSCGTGTCAVALAATIFKNQKLPATWFINPPGGRLKVEIDRDSNATLTGPAVILQEVDLESYL
jgi:diaminopimelate epimerase